MSKLSKQKNKDLNVVNERARAIDASERQHRAENARAAQAPGVVIPGERISDSKLSDTTESHELVMNGKRLQVLSHPIPSTSSPGYAAITDYLNCTFPFKTDIENLANFFRALAAITSEQFLNVRNCGKGMNGYERSYDLGEDGAKFCCVGQRNTALLMLPGKACHTIPNWEKLIVLLRDQFGARITRWDGAVDDFEGSYSVDWAVEQYKAGQFSNGGNKPSCRQNGNWIDPDGSGRTLYIGKRQNGKMLRVYEKGMQCGGKYDPWVRWELELHNVDRVVPWEVLLNPGQYIAGAYPKALSWIKDEMSRIRTVKKETELSYDHLVSHASNAYGRLFNVMLEVEDSPEAVINKLRKDGLPKRLRMPIVASKDQ
ncbi:MAG: replication initiation factor domain-containing protein [Pseudomonadota bacterium]